MIFDSVEHYFFQKALERGINQKEYLETPYQKTSILGYLLGKIAGEELLSPIDIANDPALDYDTSYLREV